MDVKTRIAALACAGVSAACWARDVVDEYKLYAQSNETFTAASVVAGDGWPEDLGATPIFWLDASQTNDWEFAEDGTVWRVPSRVGSRALIADVAGAYPFTKWSGGAMQPPRVVADDELKCGFALDFGALGKGGGLIFDSWKPDGADDTCLASNVLRDVCSVVAVYGSQNGGGFLLGGGQGPTGDGYGYHRGGNLYSGADALDYYNPIFNGSHAMTAMCAGWFWHDGMRTDPCTLGFSGGWEVIAAETVASDPLTTYDTFGVGVNDTRAFMYNRSGGMKIAELLIFPDALTQEQIEKLDHYLDAKWLGRGRRGKNGRAYAGRVVAAQENANGYHEWAETAADVAEGRTLEIGEFRGGRHSRAQGACGDETEATFTKTGAGTLVLDDAARYAGAVVLAGGTLKFPEQRAVPEADALPAGLFARFDASSAKCETETDDAGDARVTRWYSELGKTYYGKEILLAAKDGAIRPVRKTETVCGATRTVLDFGTYSNPGAYLMFTTNEAPATPTKNFAIPGICTAMYVVRPRTSCGYLLSGSLRRDSGAWTGDVLANYQQQFSRGFGNVRNMWSSRGGVVRVDGVVQPGEKRFDHLDWQVVTVQTPGNGSGIYWLGNEGISGGYCLGEVLMWNRPLTEREMQDAEAYLGKKWLGRTFAGHARAAADDATPDVQKLIVAQKATVDVPDGATVRVGSLTANATLVKTGGGTLEIQAPLAENAKSIELRGGSVCYADPADPGDSICRLADRPSAHFDASAEDTIETVLENGTNFVKVWRSADGGNAAYDNWPTARPWVDAAGEGLLNGKQTIDFGAFGADGKSLLFSKSLYDVRSAFVVWGAQAGGGFLLGSNNKLDSLNGNFYDFHRGTAGGTFGVDSSLFYRNGPGDMVGLGEILTNGVPTTYTCIPARTWQLVEAHTLAGAHVSAFARDRDISGRCGGQRLAEVVLYERALTEREKTATRNYLMKKWFGKEPDAAAFPAATHVTGAIPFASLDVAEGETNVCTFAGDADMYRLTGAGVFEKAGAGTLAVKDLTEFGGVVKVAGGALALSGKAPATDGALVENGRILHVDAAEGLATVTNATGVQVKSWASRLGDGWTVESGDAAAPVDVLPTGLADKPVVDMKTDGGQYLRFKKDGDWAFLQNIHSVFWVIGTQNGGGYLMGGGTNWHNGTQYPWHRGYAGNNNPGRGAGMHTAPLVHTSHALAELHEAAQWFVNGEKVSPAASGTLSGEWDVLAMTMAPAADRHVNAEGFAFDGRPSMTGQRGSQRLAEVIIYDRELSEAERASNEAYLMRKWGFVHAHATCGATVELAGGSLVCGDDVQSVGALAGDGDVVGSVSAAKLVADGAAAGHPAVSGTFVCPAALEIELRNLPAKLRNVEIVVLEASALEGFADAQVTFTGAAVPASYEAVLRWRDGKLVVRFRPLGMTIIVR